MKLLAKVILKLAGWKLTEGVPADIPKCVIAVAPHTSMWDFILGRLCFFALGVRVRFLIKREMFFFPLGPIVKWLGGIPVDRSKSGKMVDQVAALFDNYESLYIIVTPEGTRSRVDKWKKGFYYIAWTAKVPIALGILDYKKKIGGIVKTFTPTGDFEKEFAMVQEVYKGATGRHPEKFNLYG